MEIKEIIGCDLMSKYPLTYDEYEKKVIDLFLQTYPEDKRVIVESRLDKLLDVEPEFIEGLYEDSCFRYDNPKLYGDNCKKVFEDYLLESIPVNTLHSILGGSF